MNVEALTNRQLLNGLPTAALSVQMCWPGSVALVPDLPQHLYSHGEPRSEATALLLCYCKNY